MLNVFLAGRYVKGEIFSPDVAVGRDIFYRKGYSFTNVGKNSIFVCFDHDEVSYQKFLKSGGKIEDTYLIRMETDSILPSQYNKSIRNKYKQIFTLGSSQELVSYGSFYGHAYTYRPFQQNDESEYDYIETNMLLKSNLIPGVMSEYEWSKKDIKFAAICSNKVGLSRENNYDIRSSFFKDFYDENFHLFGPLWSGPSMELFESRIRTLFWAIRSKQISNLFGIFKGFNRNYPRARGLVSNKYEILKRTKFLFIFENSNNFVTEKIIEAFLFGAVPIYLGPDLDNFGISANSYIKFNSSLKSQDYLQMAKDLEYEDILKIVSAGQSFIQSDTFKANWTAEGIFHQIASRIEELALGRF